jgi:dGTPase
VRSRFPDCKGPRLAREIIRALIDRLVTDLIIESRERIKAAAPRNIDDVRRAGGPLIGLSAAEADGQLALKQFLRRELYAHPHVGKMTQRAQQTISGLFTAFSGDFDLMPPEHAARARSGLAAGGTVAAMRIVADYIAGMTDRFALEQHARLLD